MKQFKTRKNILMRKSLTGTEVIFCCNLYLSMSDVEEASSGAANYYPQQCSALRKGGHVMIKGKPCKIVEMSTSKTGKHGHAKVHMVAPTFSLERNLKISAHPLTTWKCPT